MEVWLIWMTTGGALILLELLIPGAIIIFIGLAAVVVGLGIKFEYLMTLDSVLITFMGSTLFFLIFIRTLFLKLFKGDETIHNVDENKDAQGTLLTVEESILPYKDGRALFRGTSWQARSDDEILKGEKAILLQLDGNILVVKSIKEKT